MHQKNDYYGNLNPAFSVLAISSAISVQLSCSFAKHFLLFIKNKPWIFQTWETFQVKANKAAEMETDCSLDYVETSIPL